MRMEQTAKGECGERAECPEPDHPHRALGSAHQTDQGERRYGPEGILGERLRKAEQNTPHMHRPRGHAFDGKTITRNGKPPVVPADQGAVGSG